MQLPGAVLAIDHGTKRTGFALADALAITVEPLSTYHGAGDGEGLLDAIHELLREREIAQILVGQPLNMDGSQGARAKDVQTFCERLGQRFPTLRIELADERLSTKEAEARLVQAGFTGPARKERKDSWSALVLLEDWLRERGWER